MATIGIAQETPDSPIATFELHKWNLTRKFLVQTDNYHVGPIEVASNIGVPRLFQLYSIPDFEYANYARCRSVQAERKGANSLWWLVTVEYSTPEPIEKLSKREQEGENDNPLLAIPEASTSFERITEPIWYIINVSDNTIGPAKASNGEVYNPPPQRESMRMNLEITRNEDLFSAHPATGIAYMESVNSDSFWGQPAGVWRVQNITASRKNKQLSGGGLFPYLEVKYSFQARGAGWDLQLLDAGTYYYKNGAGGTMFTSGSGASGMSGSCTTPDPSGALKFKTQDGHPCQGPLDGFGGKNVSCTPVFNTLRLYPRRPFQALLLPNSFLYVA